MKLPKNVLEQAAVEVDNVHFPERLNEYWIIAVKIAVMQMLYPIREEVYHDEVWSDVDSQSMVDEYSWLSVINCRKEWKQMQSSTLFLVMQSLTHHQSWLMY